MADDSKTNVIEFTVSEISAALKRTVEDAFGNVRVRGEISGYRGPHSSGHAYFALKDDRARLEAVIWRGVFSRLRFKPEEGMEVIASGKLSTYPGSSKYQIVIERLEPAGAGALMALLEERKRKLAAEGLFDAARKQLLPHMPRVIGVVTSPTGAVIRDIVHRIADRFPLRVIVWPVRVQGETSGAEVAAAITGFNALEPDGAVARPDIIIVARGGGSLEDLWGFNDEAVVRAAAASDIPLISAVGHETDWTLIDHAADVRAPTPTGAAEMAVPVKVELEAALAALHARLGGALRRRLDRGRQDLRALARALPQADQLLALPRRRFDEAALRHGRALAVSVDAKRAQLATARARLSPAALRSRMEAARHTLDRLAAALPRGHRRGLEQRRALLGRRRLTAALLAPRTRQARQALNGMAAALDQAGTQTLTARRIRIGEAGRLLIALSYQATLARGFAIVRDARDRPIASAQDIDPGDALGIEFADGRVAARADGPAKPDEPAPKPRKRGAKTPADQGSLF